MNEDPKKLQETLIQFIYFLRDKTKSKKSFEKGFDVCKISSKEIEYITDTFIKNYVK